jgi:MFS family permease
MIHFSPLSSARLVPVEYRSNLVHLGLDIAWFGVLSGSAMAFVAVFAARQGASAYLNLIFALPAGRWLEKHSVGRAVFWTSVLHRAFYLLWVPLPALLAPHYQVWTLIGLTLLMSVPGVALAIGFNALFADAVPPEWRGYVAGVRNSLLAITFVSTSLICGYILSRLPFPQSYQIVFGIGFLGAAMSSFHLSFVRPLSKREVLPRVGHSLGDMARPGVIRIIGDGLRLSAGLRFLTRGRGHRLLRSEILNSPFGTIMVVLFAFHLAQYLPAPLFPLYMVNRLHLSDQVIGLGTALFYATVFLGSTQLAHLTRQLGNRRVVAIGAALMTIYPALMALSRGVGLFLFLSLVGGSGWALAGGALTNYILDKVPEGDRPAHLAWYNLALSGAILLGSLAGPLLGSWLGLSAALALCAAVMTTIAFCPECDHRFKLGARPRIGQRRVCPNCSTRLEIVNLSPVELDVYDIYVPSAGATPHKNAAAEAICPKCDHSLKLGTHPREGQQVMCLECTTHLEVVSLNPLELDIPMIGWKKGLR